MAKKKTTKSVASFPVAFGRVSIGDNTAGIPVTFDREKLNPVAADEMLCGHRLAAKLAVGGSGGDPDQQVLFDDLDYQLEATLEVKSYTVKPKTVKATMNVCLADIDIEILGHFATRQGQLVVEGVEDIPEEPDREARGE